METANLIIQVLILLGIIYVAFIQDRVTKIKDSLWETLKDYPDIAEKRFAWKEEEIKKETEKEVIEITAKLESVIKKREERLEIRKEWINDFARVLVLIFTKLGYIDSRNNITFHLAIKETNNKKARETLYELLDMAQDKIKEQKQRQRILKREN